MKFNCRHPTCPLPKHEYDETEFMQYLQHLTAAERDTYLALHWCPSCYEGVHPILSSTARTSEEKEEISQVSSIF